MFLPIETHDLLFAMFELIAIGLGIWLMVCARGVPRLAAAPVRNINLHHLDHRRIGDVRPGHGARGRFEQHKAGYE